MSSNRVSQPVPNTSLVAERLLAHARLCEQIAQASRNAETAEKLKRIAGECTRAAARMAPATTSRTQH